MVASTEFTDALQAFNEQSSGEDFDMESLLASVIEGEQKRQDAKQQHQLKTSGKQAVQIVRRPKDRLTKKDITLLQEETIAKRIGAFEQFEKAIGEQDAKRVREITRYEEPGKQHAPAYDSSTLKSGLNNIPKIAKTKKANKNIDKKRAKQNVLDKVNNTKTKQKPKLRSGLQDLKIPKQQDFGEEVDLAQFIDVLEQRQNISPKEDIVEPPKNLRKKVSKKKPSKVNPKFATDLKHVVHQVNDQAMRNQFENDQAIRTRVFTNRLQQFENDFLIGTQGQLNKDVLLSVLMDSYTEFEKLHGDKKDKDKNSFFDQLKSGLLSLGSLVGGTLLQKAIWPFIKTLFTKPVTMLKNSLKSVGQMIRSGFGKVWKPIEQCLNTIFGWFKNFKNNIMKMLNSIKSKFGKLFGSVKAKITSIFNGVRNGISKFVSTIFDHAKNVIDKIGQKFAQLKQFSLKVFSGIKNKLAKVGEVVKQASSKLKPAFKFASNQIAHGKTVIKNGYQKSEQLIKQGVQKSVEITQKTKSGVDKAVQVVRNSKAKTTQAVTKAKDAVLKQVSKTTSTIKTGASNTAKAVKSAGSKISTKAKDLLLNKLNNKPTPKQSVFRSGLNKTKQFVQKAGSKAVQVGKQGLQNVAKIASNLKGTQSAKVLNKTGAALKSVAKITSAGGKVLAKASPIIAAADTVGSGISMAKDIYDEGLLEAGDKFRQEAKKKKWWENALDLVMDPAKFAFNVEELTKKTLDGLGVDKAINKMKQAANSVKDPYWVCESCPLAQKAKADKQAEQVMADMSNQFTFKDDGDSAPFALQG